MMADYESIQRVTECPIHLGKFVKPKALPCQHTFCEDCLKKCQRNRGGILICPTCRRHYGRSFDISMLPNNYTVLALLDAGVRKCACVDKPLFCTDCSELSCQCPESDHIHHDVHNVKNIKDRLSDLKTALEEDKVKVDSQKAKLHDDIIKPTRAKVQNYREQLIRTVNSICDASLEEIDAETAGCKKALDDQSEQLSSVKNLYSEAEDMLSKIHGPQQPSAKAKAWEKINRAMEASPPQTHNMEVCGLEFKPHDVVNSNLVKAGEVYFIRSIADSSKSQIVEVRYDKVSKQAVVTLRLRNNMGQDVINTRGPEVVITKHGVSVSNDSCVSTTYRNNRCHKYVFPLKYSGTYTINASINHVNITNSPKELVIKPQIINQNGYIFGQSMYRGAHDIAVFKDELFVTDKYNRRVVVIDRSGQLLRKFSINETHMDGAFEPFGITVSNRGLLYITDMNNHEIFVCDTFGNVQQRIGKTKLKKPNGITLTKNDEILVVDYDDCCLYMFRNDGRFKGKFGGPGKEPGQFSHPWFVAINSKGHWVVSDCDNRRFQIFDGNFRLIKSVDVGYLVRGVVIDSEDNIILSVVIDNAWLKKNYNHAVKMYNANGTPYGDIALGDGLLRPRGMCITEDSRGMEILIVTDDSNALHKYEMI